MKDKYASEYFEGLVYFNGDLQKRQQQAVRISGKEVEEVGFDKIRKQLADFHELRIVILDGLRMTEPKIPFSEEPSWVLSPPSSRLKDIKETCPKIIEVDLSRNLFEDWREIILICEQLNNLRSLKVE